MNSGLLDLFLNGSRNAYVPCMGGSWYGFVPSLTCIENVSLKHPMPEENITMCCVVLLLFWHLLSCPFLLLALQENNMFPGCFCYEVTDYFKKVVFSGLSCSDCSFTCPLL